LNHAPPMAGLEVAEPPHGPWGWFGHPQRAKSGWLKPPPFGLGVGSATPERVVRGWLNHLDGP